MAHKLGWLAALVIVAMLGVVGDSWTLQEAASLGDRSVALASQATPTSTPERFAPIDIRRPLQQPTATSTPMPEREIVMPDETIRLATPTATRQPEPPEICRTRRGAIVPCDDMGPGDEGDDDVGEASPCIMVLDVFSGEVEEIAEECEEFEEKLPSSGEPRSRPRSDFLTMLLPAGKKLVGVKTFSVPTDLVELVVNMTIGQVQVHVDRGEGDSSVAFPPELGMQPLRFTIPDLEIDTIFGDAKEYPHDINSSEVRFQLEDQAEDFPRGFIRLVIEFEQRDEEIHGTWHGEMDNMKLRVDLALKTLLGKISYGDVRSKFTFDLNMIGVPGWALDPIFNYSDKIANLTEDAMVSIFDNGYVRGGFSARITEQVEPYLGPDPVIVGVRVTDGQLIIRYYNN